MKSFSSILISTFSPWKKGLRSPTNGMIEPMLSYFLPRFKRVWLLDQPYPGSDSVIPFVEEYALGKLQKKEVIKNYIFPLIPFLHLTNKPGTQAPHKLRDFLSTLEVGCQTSEPFDLFIGMEAINALAGIMLRKIGKVKKVVYYVSDYSPNRFPNPLFNMVYLWLDRTAAMYSDFIWDVSLAMQPARIKAGLNLTKSAPVIHVPNALFKEQITYLPWNKRKKHTVVFVGTLGLENGPDIAIEAFQKVVAEIPDATLHIIGGGGLGFESEYLKKLSEKYHLEKNVIFHGFISDLKKLSQLIKQYEVAIAPYKKIPGSHRLYGDATKLRLYMAVGLPIIVTDVPPLGKELEKKGAALTIKSSKGELARAIISILNNPQKRKILINNAIKTAKDNLWEKTYQNALDEIGKIID